MSEAAVVVGTDLSGTSSEAVRQAAAWAARSGGRLLVVHVAPDQIFQALETPKVADALAERVAAITEPYGVTVEIAIESGSPHAALVSFADARRAALLCVGASGHGALRVFGTTAEQVVRHAHCPVLVARTSPEEGLVLSTTDFSEPSLSAIRFAAGEATRRKVPLRLVHALYEPESPLSVLGPAVISVPELPAADRELLEQAAEQTLRTELEAAGAPGAYDVLWGPPGPTIAEHARAIGAALVVVGTHGRTGFARMALGSVAEAITRQSPCSVLVVRTGASSSAGRPTRA
jgi:nucleotide-binding universal stress UspA family protein